MCFGWMWKFFIRLYKSICEGFIEYCQRGCMMGSQYLVRPNYHYCERVVWFVILTMGCSLGYGLIFYYMNNFSENVFRVVDDFRNHYQPFHYPTLGICEMGSEDDEEMLDRVAQALNGSLYKQYPALLKNGNLKNFAHMLTFRNLYSSEKFEEFFKYTKTLAPEVKEYLEGFNYNALAKNISSTCEEFFIKCSWLEESFDCCNVFQPIPTMMGKCFLFNSMQTNQTIASQMVRQMETFKEPYILKLIFSKPAEILILNNYDIPTCCPLFNKYKMKKRGTELTMAFEIVPTLNDDGLLHLDRHTLGCVPADIMASSSKKLYAFESYTTCISEKFYEEQMHLCNCTNLYGPETEGQYCNLSQFRCLEENDFVNPKSLGLFSSNCFKTCEDCMYIVHEAFYSKNTEIDLRKVFTLTFVLLNFPTRNKRRQAIRQAEDKLTAFGNILGLFMGFNVVNMIEFFYLICCAFWKYKMPSVAEDEIRGHEHTSKRHKDLKAKITKEENETYSNVRLT